MRGGRTAFFSPILTRWALLTRPPAVSNAADRFIPLSDTLAGMGNGREARALQKNGHIAFGFERRCGCDGVFRVDASAARHRRFRRDEARYSVHQNMYSYQKSSGEHAETVRKGLEVFFHVNFCI